MNQIELPEPDQAGLNHSEQLCRLIIDEIEHKGPISFSHYWQRAMFEPGLGYYSAGLAKIGQAGDFVTAPELGQVFGTCLANQLAEMMTHLTMPSLMELGAGTGALAATILNRLSELDTLPEAYLILEVSADLRQRQEQFLRQHCPEFLPIVQWLDQPPQNAWQGIVFGNEVVDALPANRYRYDNGQWQQLGVTYQNQRFAWSVIDIDPKDRGFLKQCSDPWPVKPTHYQTERQPKLDLWVTALTETLQKGYLFLIDYGYNNAEYYHPQRCDGTLICHYRHRAHDDPFVWPGLQDISVSVNFSAVAEAVDLAGLRPLGFTSQASFLMASGMEQFIHPTKETDEQQKMALLSEIKQLTLPSEMGERFCCFIAGKHIDAKPVGFNLNSQLHRL